MTRVQNREIHAAYGRDPAPADATRAVRIRDGAKALLAKHPFAGPLTSARRLPALAAPIWELPARRCSRFVGRAEEVRALRGALLADGPRVIVVSGPGGSGKSELVREALDAGELRDAFAACTWVTVRRHEFLGRPTHSPSPRLDPLAEVASHLGIALANLPAVLERERILVVLDNAEALDDEDALISRFGQMAGAARVVVTSRNSIVASFVLPFPPTGPLAGLGPSDALALLAHELAVRKAGTDIDAALLSRIARATGGAPLALHWVAGRAPAAPLAALVHAVESGRAPDLYGFMFGSAWERLPIEGRVLLRVLAHETVEAVPAELLPEIAPRRPTEAVASLRGASLLETSGESAPVTLHPLTRGSVRARSKALPDPARRAGIGLRYLIRSLADDSRGSGAALPLGGLRNYLEWMALVTPADPVLAMVAWTKLSRYLWEHWHWYLYEECTRLGDEAARAIGRRRAAAGELLLALTRLDLTYLRLEQGRLDEALALGRSARAIFERLDDDAGLSLVDRYLGQVQMEIANPASLAEARRRWVAALRAVRRGRNGYPRRGAPIEKAVRQLRALDLWETIQGGYGPYRGSWDPSEALLHTALGEHALKTGDPRAAIPPLERGLRLCEKAEGRWPGSEASALLGLADAHAQLNDLDTARSLAERALATAGSAERLDLQSSALLTLAKLDATAAPDRARERARRARSLFEELGRALGIAEADRLLAALQGV